MSVDAAPVVGLGAAFGVLSSSFVDENLGVTSSVKNVEWSSASLAILSVLAPTASKTPVSTQSTTSDLIRTVGHSGAWIACTNEQATPRWSQYVSRRFNELSDPHRDVPVSRSVLRRAWGEVARLLPLNIATPSVVPSAAGGVELVWHKSGWDVELTFDPNESTAWAHSRSTGDEIFGRLDDTRSQVSRILQLVSS
jgi:hypothetical protein